MCNIYAWSTTWLIGKMGTSLENYTWITGYVHAIEGYNGWSYVQDCLETINEQP
jgi:hypothetical protein